MPEIGVLTLRSLWNDRRAIQCKVDGLQVYKFSVFAARSPDYNALTRKDLRKKEPFQKSFLVYESASPSMLPKLGIFNKFSSLNIN